MNKYIYIYICCVLVSVIIQDSSQTGSTERDFGISGFRDFFELVLLLHLGIFNQNLADDSLNHLRIILRWFFAVFEGIFSNFLQDRFRIAPVSFRHFSEIFIRSFQKFSGSFQDRFTIIPGSFQDQSRIVSSVLQDFYKIIYEFFRIISGYCRNITRNFLRIISEVFRIVSRISSSNLLSRFFSGIFSNIVSGLRRGGGRRA